MLRFRRAEPTESGRLEAFSDGVFAVAITLLALDLGRIHADPSVGDGTLFSAIRILWPTLLAFAASFVFIGVAWTNHHNVFVRVKNMSRSLNGANLLLLAGVSMIPWVTSVLSEALTSHDNTNAIQAVVLYGTVTTIGALTWALLFHVLSKNPDLLIDTQHAKHFAADRFGALVALASTVIAIILAYYWTPLAAAVLYLALPLFFAAASEGFEWDKNSRK